MLLYLAVPLTYGDIFKYREGSDRDFFKRINLSCSNELLDEDRRFA